MDIFDGIRDHATNPLLRELLTLVTRDESRHMGFGILYVAEYMRTHSRDERIEFARRWLGQILFSATDQPGPIMLGRLLRRLREAGVDDADAIAPELLREQQEINARKRAEVLAGRRLPQLMKSARRAGLLEPGDPRGARPERASDREGDAGARRGGLSTAPAAGILSAAPPPRAPHRGSPRRHARGRWRRRAARRRSRRRANRRVGRPDRCGR